MNTKRAKILLAILLASLTGLLLSSDLLAQELVFVKIVSAKANVRQIASSVATVLEIVEKGSLFAVLEKTGEWYKIQLPSGTKGFLHQSVVEEVGGTAAPPAKQAVPAVAPPLPLTPATARREPAKGASSARPQQSDSFSMFLIRAGFYLASDVAFRDVYGNGLVFGGELRIGRKTVSGWLEGTTRSRTGQFSYSQDTTEVRVTAVEGGTLFRIKSGPFSPYIGAGLGFYMFKETDNLMIDAEQNKIGFCGFVGFSGLLGDVFVLDARLKYGLCKMLPADFEIQIGGLTAGIGLGIRF